uniref:Uncharacterized protein n=1 Tax=Strongyloides papillosus TaxID=174720 RepID=A0A0N5CIJ9_STREA
MINKSSTKHSGDLYQTKFYLNIFKIAYVIYTLKNTPSRNRDINLVKTYLTIINNSWNLYIQYKITKYLNDCYISSNCLTIHQHLKKLKRFNIRNFLSLFTQYIAKGTLQRDLFFFYTYLNYL